MNGVLRTKYWIESWLLFVSLALGVVIFCWFRVWIVGELDTAQFRQIIDLLPKDWRKFSPVNFDWLVSYLGRTSLTLDEPMLIMLVTGWSMIRGSDVVAGELSRGTMEMLLSQPVTRRQVFISHACWTIVLLAALTTLTWIGMTIGIWTTSVTETTYPTLNVLVWGLQIPLRFLPPHVETIPMSDMVNPWSFWPGILNLFCLGVFFGGLSACCSAHDRYRWRTLGFVIGFYFANAGLKLLGMASEKWAWVTNCSVFGFYSPAAAIERTDADPNSLWQVLRWDTEGHFAGAGSLTNGVLLMVLGLLLYVWGCRVFERRDLPAPV